jgi:hypothetical protein
MTRPFPNKLICRGEFLLIKVDVGEEVRYGVFDLARRCFLRRDVIVGGQPGDLGFSPDAMQVVATDWESGEVMVMNAVTGAIRSRFVAGRDAGLWTGSSGIQLVSKRVSVFNYDGHLLHEWQPKGEFQGATDEVLLHAEGRDIIVRRWTGEVLGRMKKGRTRILPDSVAEGGGKVVFGEMRGPIRSFDTVRGVESWSQPLPEGIHATVMAVAEGKIHAVCRAFETERGAWFLDMDPGGQVIGEWSSEYPLTISYSEFARAWIGHCYELIPADGGIRTFVPELAAIAE